MGPKDFLDCLMVQTFIYEICEVERGNLKKLDDALARALEFEAAKQASKSHLWVRHTLRYSSNMKPQFLKKHLN